MDGAGGWRRLRDVTLPGIRSVIVLLLILRLAFALSVGFEQYYLQRNAVGADAAEVLDTFIYFRGIQSGDWGFAAAVGLVRGVVGADPDRRRPTGWRSARRGRDLLDGATRPVQPAVLRPDYRQTIGSTRRWPNARLAPPQAARSRRRGWRIPIRCW